MCTFETYLQYIHDSDLNVTSTDELSYFLNVTSLMLLINCPCGCLQDGGPGNPIANLPAKMKVTPLHHTDILSTFAVLIFLQELEYLLGFWLIKHYLSIFQKEFCVRGDGPGNFR